MDQEIVSRAMGRPSARSARSGEGRQVSMEGEPAPNDGVGAFDQGAQTERRQRHGAFGDRAADTFVSVEEMAVEHVTGAWPKSRM